MTDDNSNLVDNIENDLNEFEQDFFQTGQSSEDVQEDAEQELPDNPEEDNPLAPEDEDEAEDEVEEETPKPKKKPSFQERIDELTAKAREAERREAATQAELARLRQELEANSKQENKETPKVELREHLPDDAPNPDALDDDGKPLYPLGEFDPLFIRDLTKFTIEQETAKAKEAERLEAMQKAHEEEMTRVQTEWNARIEAKREELPDFSEKVQGMVSAFEGIDPGYGDYLALTVMQSEVGPEILYYLADNIGEAQKIVASGPAAATLAIGRLEAQLSKPKFEDVKRNRMSEAAPPPEARTRGAGGRFAVSPDTDDLDAFEKEYFKK